MLFIDQLRRITTAGIIAGVCLTAAYTLNPAGTEASVPWAATMAVAEDLIQGLAVAVNDMYSSYFGT